MDNARAVDILIVHEAFPPERLRKERNAIVCASSHGSASGIRRTISPSVSRRPAASSRANVQAMRNASACVS